MNALISRLSKLFKKGSEHGEEHSSGGAQLLYVEPEPPKSQAAVGHLEHFLARSS